MYCPDSSGNTQSRGEKLLTLSPKPKPPKPNPRCGSMKRHGQDSYKAPSETAPVKQHKFLFI